MTLKELLYSLPFEFSRTVAHKTNLLLKRRPSSAPFLSGDTFARLADIVINNKNDFDQFDAFINRFNGAQKRCIIFIHSDFLKDFEKKYLPKINFYFVLISHQSDVIVDASYASLADAPFLLHWFCQNALLVHKKVTPLPIGLENQFYHNSGNVASFKKLSKKLQNGKVQKIARVVIALNFSTNPLARFNCYKAFWQKPITKELQSFISSNLYRKTILPYQFIASPSGNGVDCHRTWEAIYLGIVPLLEDNAMNRFFESLNLPLVIVSNWQDFAQKTVDELDILYRQVMQKSTLDACFIDYWQKQIFSARDAEIVVSSTTMTQSANDDGEK